MSGVKNRSGIYDHFKLRGRKKGPMSFEVRSLISQNRKGKGIGNKNGLGKNLGNQNAAGKNVGVKNGNWKGGVSRGKTVKERIRIASRPKPDSCELCGSMDVISYDHHHNCGTFRGWLCRRCNLVLGMVRDNFELLNKLSEYVCNHKCDQKDSQGE